MTEEEIRKIASTHITMDCFEMGNFKLCKDYIGIIWEELIRLLEDLRITYNETKDNRYLKELIRLLPNSYKVVKIMTLTEENEELKKKITELENELRYTRYCAD